MPNRGTSNVPGTCLSQLSIEIIVYQVPGMIVRTYVRINSRRHHNLLVGMRGTSSTSVRISGIQDLARRVHTYIRSGLGIILFV